jgi:hypothetical protein
MTWSFYVVLCQPELKARSQKAFVTDGTGLGRILTGCRDRMKVRDRLFQGAMNRAASVFMERLSLLASIPTSRSWRYIDSREQVKREHVEYPFCRPAFRGEMEQLLHRRRTS